MKTRYLALVPLVFVVGGCRRKTLAPTGAPLPSAPASAATSPLSLTLATDKAVYKRGELIALTLIARNGAKTALPVTFTSGQSFDIEAQRDQNEVTVWRWSAGQMFTQMVRAETWAPGEPHRYNANWDGRTSAEVAPGEPVAPGRYVLRARLTGTSPGARQGGTFSAPVTIEVAP